MLHAAAPTFGPFFALRFLLGRLGMVESFKPFDSDIGMCESCVSPTLVILISMFYKKNEQVRIPYPYPPQVYDSLPHLKASRISWFYFMVSTLVYNVIPVTNRLQNGMTQVFGGFVAYGVVRAHFPC